MISNFARTSQQIFRRFNDVARSQTIVFVACVSTVDIPREAFYITLKLIWKYLYIHIFTFVWWTIENIYTRISHDTGSYTLCMLACVSAEHTIILYAFHTSCVYMSNSSMSHSTVGALLFFYIYYTYYINQVYNHIQYSYIYTVYIWAHMAE